MEYIKVIGENYQDAEYQARSKYGSSIIVLNHKEVKIGGLLGTGLFAKSKVELTAALPDEEQARSSGKLKAATGKITTKDIVFKEEKNEQKSTAQHKPADSRLLLKDMLSQQELAATKEKFLQVADETRNREKNIQRSSQDLANSLLKKAVAESAAATPDMTRIEKSLQEILEAVKAWEGKSRALPELSFYESALDSWMTKLTDLDFSPSFSDHLMHELREKLTFEEQNDRELIRRKLSGILRNHIGISTPILKKGERKKVVAMIGPTGVGKTTTLAKIGAIYTFYENRTVSFITIDNYRIAATEQLKRYSSIINIKTHVVNGVEELNQVIQADSSDLILIDTSGRSPYHKEHIADMERLFQSLDVPVEKILITSATAKRKDQEVIFTQFGKVGIDKVIVTKIDESNAIGGLIEVADKYNKGLCYITNGQDVPSDIEEANAAQLVHLMLDYKEERMPRQE